MLKLVLIYITLFLLLINVFPQQAPIYSQYVLNEFIINPAVAGIDGMTSINFSGRKQWLGWEYGPENYLASISTRVLKTPSVITRDGTKSKFKKGASGKVGLGLALYSDINGAVNRTGMNFSYTYHIFIEENQLSFGLSLIAQQFKIDSKLAQLGYNDPNLPNIQIDPLEGLIGKSTYIPDAGFGINFSGQQFSLGMSVYQLFQSPIKIGNSDVEFRQLKQSRYYHLIGTYINKIPTKIKWEYEPSFILRATESGQFNADFSLRMIYNKEYWGGISFRTSMDIIVLLGIKLNKMYFGYSFDYGFNEIAHSTFGSHEALIAIKLGDSARRYRYLERY